MKILAVDTASLVASVAVMEDDRLLGEYTVNHRKTHSQSMMPMMEELLRSLETDISDIDVFSALTGPGSFTGLRIGITTIKAIAYTMNKPVVGVTSLDSLAYNIPFTASYVCPIMDARNDQVYTAVYRWSDGRPVLAEGYMGIHIAELAALLKAKPEGTVFLGDAVQLHGKYLKDELGELCGFAPGNLMLQKASSAAQAAMNKVKLGEITDCYELTPFYLRKSQAERELERKNI